MPTTWGRGAATAPKVPFHPLFQLGWLKFPIDLLDDAEERSVFLMVIDGFRPASDTDSSIGQVLNLNVVGVYRLHLNTFEDIGVVLDPQLLAVGLSLVAFIRRGDRFRRLGAGDCARRDQQQSRESPNHGPKLHLWNIPDGEPVT